MGTHARRSGATLIDLIATLGLAGILLSVAAPRLGTARDKRATVAARDAAAALVHEARMLALAQGSAVLVIDFAAGTLSLEAPAGSPAGPTHGLGASFGVALTVDHASGPVRLSFDGLGLGRLVNRTVRFRRGGEEARLSLSTYGRPRRW